MISVPALAVLFGAATVLWTVSLARRDASIVDIAWGPAFAVVAGVCLGARGWEAARPQWVLGAMVLVWGVRLGGYLAWRNHGEPEDRRYAAMRRARGKRFAAWSLPAIFWLQAGLAWTIALPVQAALSSDASAWHPWHAVGAAVWLLGITFETTADLQLARFKANPENRGRVLDTGLWRLSRHPNYFGDFTVWWGLYAFALGSGAPWWTCVGPVLMSVLLLRVSGVTLLESTIGERRPAYAAYVERTSAFFPWPPRA